MAREQYTPEITWRGQTVPAGRTLTLPFAINRAQDFALIHYVPSGTGTNRTIYKGNDTGFVQSVNVEDGTFSLQNDIADTEILVAVIDYTEPTQLGRYSNSISLNFRIFEDNLDKLVGEVQSLRAEVDRSVKYDYDQFEAEAGKTKQQVFRERTHLPPLAEGDEIALGHEGVVTNRQTAINTAAILGLSGRITTAEGDIVALEANPVLTQSPSEQNKILKADIVRDGRRLTFKTVGDGDHTVTIQSQVNNEDIEAPNFEAANTGVAPSRRAVATKFDAESARITALENTPPGSSVTDAALGTAADENMNTGVGASRRAIAAEFDTEKARITALENAPAGSSITDDDLGDATAENMNTGIGASRRAIAAEFDTEKARITALENAPAGSSITDDDLDTDDPSTESTTVGASRQSIAEKIKEIIDSGAASGETITGSIFSSSVNDTGTPTTGLFGIAFENENEHAYLSQLGLDLVGTLDATDIIDYYVIDFSTFTATSAIGDSVIKTGRFTANQLEDFDTINSFSGIFNFMLTPDIDFRLPSLGQYGVFFHVKDSAGTPKEVNIKPQKSLGVFGPANNDPFIYGEEDRVFYFSKSSGYLLADNLGELTDGSTDIREGDRPLSFYVGWKIKITRPSTLTQGSVSDTDLGNEVGETANTGVAPSRRAVAKDSDTIKSSVTALTNRVVTLENAPAPDTERTIGNFFNWYPEPGHGPIEMESIFGSYFQFRNLDSFDNDFNENLWGLYKVSTEHIAGNIIRMRFILQSDEASGNNLNISITCYHIRLGVDLLTSTDNERTQSASGRGNSAAPFNNSINLTDASGQINSNDIRPGDVLKIRMRRLLDLSDEDLRFYPGLCEIMEVTT